jgi:EAL domain-containing protein (putative c-di-GMP-specific phosphodiesterase class I)
LVQVARSLDARLVAEGVEARAELEVVSAFGVEWCQGYLFAEPVLVS